MALIGKILGRLTVGSLGVRKEHRDVWVEAIEFPNVHIKDMDPIGYRALLLSLIDQGCAARHMLRPECLTLLAEFPDPIWVASGSFLTPIA